MIEKLFVENLSASWGQMEVLNNITFSVPTNSLTCLSGPNGTGKSTLMSVLAGTYDSSLGVKCTASTFSGKPRPSQKEIAKTVAWMQQNEQNLWDYSVRDYVLMGRWCHSLCGFYTRNDYMVTDETMERVQISHLSKKSILELSGGEFQKVRIARCLAQKSKFILLDEPVANLDFIYQEEILALLRKIAHEDGTGILASIHDLNTAVRFCDSLALLPKKDNVLFGKPEVIFTEENLFRTYGHKFRTFTHPVYGCMQSATDSTNA